MTLTESIASRRLTSKGFNMLTVQPFGQQPWGLEDVVTMTEAYWKPRHESQRAANEPHAV
jgi:hypothetical protein